MTERPIILSAPMIPPTLDGRKTMTRRIVKPQPGHMQDSEPEGYCWVLSLDGHTELNPKRDCPYGKPGDRLWVRETWRIGTHNDCACYEPCGRCVVGKPMYAADFAGEASEWGPWRPSIHMPRWASRITLEITDVRIERLQDITNDDACQEGIDIQEALSIPASNGAIAVFSELWESLHGPGSWDRNDWVRVISFKRVLGGPIGEHHD